MSQGFDLCKVGTGRLFRWAMCFPEEKLIWSLSLMDTSLDLSLFYVDLRLLLMRGESEPSQLQRHRGECLHGQEI